MKKKMISLFTLVVVMSMCIYLTICACNSVERDTERRMFLTHDSQGNYLKKEEIKRAEFQAMMMVGQYDPDLYILHVVRSDEDGNIMVIPQLKPAWSAQ